MEISASYLDGPTDSELEDDSSDDARLATGFSCCEHGAAVRRGSNGLCCNTDWNLKWATCAPKGEELQPMLTPTEGQLSCTVQGHRWHFPCSRSETCHAANRNDPYV